MNVPSSAMWNLFLEKKNMKIKKSLATIIIIITNTKTADWYKLSIFVALSSNRMRLKGKSY